MLRWRPKLAAGEGWMTDIFLQISTCYSCRGVTMEIQCPEKQLLALTQRKLEVSSFPSIKGWKLSYSLVPTFQFQFQQLKCFSTTQVNKAPFFPSVTSEVRESKKQLSVSYLTQNTKSKKKFQPLKSDQKSRISRLERFQMCLSLSSAILAFLL